MSVQIGVASRVSPPSIFILLALEEGWHLRDESPYGVCRSPFQRPMGFNVEKRRRLHVQGGMTTNFGDGAGHIVEFSPALPYHGAFFFRTNQQGSC